MEPEKIALLNDFLFSLNWTMEHTKFGDCFIIGSRESVDEIVNLLSIAKVKVKPEIEWIDEYRNLFPVGIRSGGFPVRGDRKGCIKKMKAFLELYPEYTKEIILKVTKNYVEMKKLEGYAYMQLAHFFINKEGISSLASECEDFKEIVQIENIKNI